jgi:hypothetical protein
MEQHERIRRVPSQMLESKSVRNNDKYSELRNKKRKEMSKKERQQKKEKRDEHCVTFRVILELRGDLETNTFQCIQIDSSNYVESNLYRPQPKRIKKQTLSSHCCTCCICCCNCGRSEDEKQMMSNCSPESKNMELCNSIKKNNSVKVEELP